SCGSLSTCVDYSDDYCSTSPELTFAGTANTTYYILIGNYSNATLTGTFHIKIYVPLSIKLGDISAENMEGTQNRISWNGLSEEAGDYYELERSTDGMYFNKMLTIEGSDKANTYSVIDKDGVQGVNYYRLRLLDNAGNISFSKIVSAVVNQK